MQCGLQVLPCQNPQTAPCPPLFCWFPSPSLCSAYFRFRLMVFPFPSFFIFPPLRSLFHSKTVRSECRIHGQGQPPYG